MSGNERISPRENPRGDRFEDRRQAADQALERIRRQMHFLAGAIDQLTERCSSTDANRLDQGYELLSAAVDDGMRALRNAVENARMEVG